MSLALVRVILVCHIMADGITNVGLCEKRGEGKAGKQNGEGRIVFYKNNNYQKLTQEPMRTS
jgi:hypothetical protein